MSTEPKNDNSNPEWVKKCDQIMMAVSRGEISRKEALEKLAALDVSEDTAHSIINMAKGISDEKNI